MSNFKKYKTMVQLSISFGQDFDTMAMVKTNAKAAHHSTSNTANIWVDDADFSNNYSEYIDFNVCTMTW